MKKLISSLACLLLILSLKAQRHSFEFHTGVQRSFRMNTAIANSASGLDRITRNEAADTPFFGPVFGLSYQLSLPKNIIVSVGLEFSNIGFSTPDPEYNYPDEHDGSGGSLAPFRIESYLDIPALSLPITAGYVLKLNEKFDLELSGGGIISRVIEPTYYRAYRYVDQGTGLLIDKEYEEKREFPDLLVGIRASGSVVYRINSSFSFIFAGTGSYFLTEYNTGVTSEHLYSNGLNFNLRYTWNSSRTQELG